MLGNEKQINWQTSSLLGDDEAIIQHLATHLIKGIAVNAWLFPCPWNCWWCSLLQFQDCSRVISACIFSFPLPFRWPTGDQELDERFLHPRCNSEGNQGSQELAWKEDGWARYGICWEKYIAEFLRKMLFLPRITDESGQSGGRRRCYNLAFSQERSSTARKIPEG